MLDQQKRSKLFYSVFLNTMVTKIILNDMKINKKQRIRKLVGKLLSRKLQFAYINFRSFKGEQFGTRIGNTIK
jgi:hypothetical protein